MVCTYVLIGLKNGWQPNQWFNNNQKQHNQKTQFYLGWAFFIDFLTVEVSYGIVTNGTVGPGLLSRPGTTAKCPSNKLKDQPTKPTKQHLLLKNFSLVINLYNNNKIDWLIASLSEDYFYCLCVCVLSVPAVQCVHACWRCVCVCVCVYPQVLAGCISCIYT